MADSRLNGPEQGLQHSFRKLLVFNGLIMATAIGLIALLIRAMPDRKPMAPVSQRLSVRPVAVVPVGGPLRLAGAWELKGDDRRLGGLSALAIDNGDFLSVSDRGAVVRFSMPSAPSPRVTISDLRVGPGPYGKKRARDAESLARDPAGRGWWVGFEQRHSLWLYKPDFSNALASVDLLRPDWGDNSGAEGLLVRDAGPLVFGEDGRDVIRIDGDRPVNLKLHAPSEVADAASAPDGSGWVLLREIRMSGISQSIAPLERAQDGYRIGAPWPLPKDQLDNFEGMTIQARPDGGWRFWLVSDNDFRSTARTLLVALDYLPPAKHDKSPAAGTGLSKNSAGAP